MEWVSPISNGLIASASVVGAIVAVVGLRTWRQEMKGRTEYHLARRIMIGVYKVRGAIHSYRIPAIWFFEYKDRPERLTEKSECDAADEAYAYQNRWTPIQEASSSLQVDLFEAEAIWEDLLGDVNKKLDRCTSRLLSASIVYLNNQRREPHRQKDRTKEEQIVMRERVPDDFDADVQAAVDGYELSLKKYLIR